MRPGAGGGPWFVAPPESWTYDSIVLPPEEARHAVKVLRLSPPDVVTVTDGRGTVARGALSAIEGRTALVDILEKETVRRPVPELVVYQGAAKGHKVDEVVEKLAELGVAEVYSYASKRSIAHWDDAKVARLNERWASIARSAAKQSRNPYVMHAEAGLRWADVLRRIENESVSVVLWEEAALPLRTALVSGTERIVLLVGPEGGLERAEAEALADAGAQLVSLGPRILRTENAALVGVAALQYHYGVIG